MTWITVPTPDWPYHFSINRPTFGDRGGGMRPVECTSPCEWINGGTTELLVSDRGRGFQLPQKPMQCRIYKRIELPRVVQLWGTGRPLFFSVTLCRFAMPLYGHSSLQNSQELRRLDMLLYFDIVTWSWTARSTATDSDRGKCPEPRKSTFQSVWSRNLRKSLSEHCGIRRCIDRRGFSKKTAICVHAPRCT